MNTEELIKAAKELVELDGEKTPDSCRFDAGNFELETTNGRFKVAVLPTDTTGDLNGRMPGTHWYDDGVFMESAWNNSAKIARALIVAVEALEKIDQENWILLRRDIDRLLGIVKGALTDIQKIAEE